MKAKRTLSSALTTRYQLIIRNEENFAEKTSLGFTYSKLILFSFLLFIVVFGMCLFLVQTVLEKWFDPKYAEPLARPSDTQLQPRDSAFRKDFEKSDLSLITLANVKKQELHDAFFFSPLTGFISDHYDVKKGHYGVDIVTKTNEPVKCIADGTVLFSSWTQDGGYVIMIQHSANLISVYKHNAELYKKVGTFVNAGEIIALVGNSGELTNGPHLHFELWYNGNSLNPEEFVTF